MRTIPAVETAYGAALLEAGRPAEALPALRLATRLSPRDGAAWQQLARAATQAGDSREAAAARAEAATPAGCRCRGPGQGAAGVCDKQAPAMDRAAWEQAMHGLCAGQNAAAARGLTAWLAQHPGDGTSWAVLGLSEFAQHDNANALIHLQRGNALGLHGSPAEVEAARYTMGILLLHAGEFDQAADLLSATAKLMPGDRRLTYALGLALLRRAELPPAASPRRR